MLQSLQRVGETTPAGYWPLLCTEGSVMPAGSPFFFEESEESRRFFSPTDYACVNKASSAVRNDWRLTNMMGGVDLHIYFMFAFDGQPFSFGGRPAASPISLPCF